MDGASPHGAREVPLLRAPTIIFYDPSWRCRCPELILNVIPALKRSTIPFSPATLCIPGSGGKLPGNAG